MELRHELGMLEEGFEPLLRRQRLRRRDPNVLALFALNPLPIPTLAATPLRHAPATAEFAVRPLIAE
jgi:hypothetical protein